MFRQIQIGGNHNNGDIFEAIVRHNCEQLDIIHMRLLDALKVSTINLAKGENAMTVTDKIWINWNPTVAARGQISTEATK